MCTVPIGVIGLRFFVDHVLKGRDPVFEIRVGVDAGIQNSYSHIFSRVALLFDDSSFILI